MLRRYVHGPGDDDPQLWYEGSGLTDRRSLQVNHQGSIVSTADASGNVLAIKAYDEYGVPSGGDVGAFQYTGQVWLPDLGMYYYKARIYSAKLGRFLQTDPIGYGDQNNLYTYVGNEPVMRRDPTGEREEYIWKNRNSLQIVIPIKMDASSTGALGSSQADIVSRVSSDFKGTYNYKGDSVTVDVKVDFLPQASKTPSNSMNVNISTTRSTTDRPNDRINMASGATSGRVSHEIGHMMGAQDKYTDINGVSKPDPGFGQNLMGDATITYSPTSRPGSIDQRNFNEIFSTPPTSETCAATGSIGRCTH